MTATAVRSDLWPHQQDGVAFLKEHDGTLLYIGMGGGKTRVAARSLERPHALPALIITRSSVIEDGIWTRECDGLRVKALRGPIAARAAQVDPSTADVFLVNYEAAWQGALGIRLLRQLWGSVIADEGHHLKSPGSKVSRFASRLASRYRIDLTGTPMAHSPLDVYGQYRFLDRRIYGTNFLAFRNQYAVMGGFEGRQVIGYQNTDDFMERFWRIAFRAEPKFDLAEPLDIPLSHQLPAAARRVYEDLESDFYAELESGTVTIANAAVKLLRLQQVAAGHVRDDAGRVSTVHSARAALLAERLEDLDPSEPVVVFARFRHDLRQVAAVASRLGRPYSEVSGSTNDLTTWKEGKSTILGVQIQSGGEGIDLTRAAHAVYYSVGHSLSDYLQSRARLVRPGQTRAVRFYHLSATSTVDARVYRALKNRQDVIESLINAPRGMK